VIWLALLLGVFIGVLFQGTFHWILLDPTQYRKKLEEENERLRRDNATLRAQLEVFDDLHKLAR
jgi:hypothetical protein